MKDCYVLSMSCMQVAKLHGLFVKSKATKQELVQQLTSGHSILTSPFLVMPHASMRDWTMSLCAPNPTRDFDDGIGMPCNHANETPLEQPGMRSLTLQRCAQVQNHNASQSLHLQSQDLFTLGWAAPSSALDHALHELPRLLTQRQLQQWCQDSGMPQLAAEKTFQNATVANSNLACLARCRCTAYERVCEQHHAAIKQMFYEAVCAHCLHYNKLMCHSSCMLTMLE